MKQKALYVVMTLGCLLFTTTSFGAHGFAWSDKANFSGTRDLTGQYNYNSSGSSIKVTYQSTGSYLISFEGLGKRFSYRGGHVQVSSYGSNKAYCKVDGWNRFQKMNVLVSCYNALGNKIDSQFTVSVRNPEENQLSYAYAYGNEPEDSEYMSEGKYTKTPGDDVSIKRTAQGQYTAVFKGLSSYLFGGGHVQVTAVGDDSKSCQVKSWHEVGPDLQTHIRCFSPNGTAEDSKFLVHVTAQALHEEDNMKAAYAWASNPSSSSYTAHSHYSSPSASIERSSQGKYKVTLNSIVGFGKSNVHVSSYGSSFAHCKVHYWYPHSGKASAHVFCFDKNGMYKDSNFVVRLVHK